MKRAKKQQRGYLLISVVVTLFLLACIALLLNRQSAVNANTASAELAAAQAEYVAEAGLRHTRWLADQNACAGDLSLVDVPFGAHSYSATVTMASGGGGTQSTVAYSVDQDAYVKEEASSQNFGSEAELGVIEKGNDHRRALYRFDLSSLPAGTTINNAVFKLYMIDGPTKGDVKVYRITSDWQEDSVTWTDIASEYDGAQVEALIPDDTASNSEVHLNLTSLVQQWINGAVPNYGVLLLSDANNDLSQYASKEYGDIDKRPVLEVTTFSGQLAASPATIDVIASLGDGVSRQITRSDVPVYNVASSQVITLKPGAEGKDTFIESQGSKQNDNNANDKDLKTDSESNKQLRALLEFDLGRIPRGARVTSAELSLHINDNKGQADIVKAHRITRDWTEDGVTWLSRNGSDVWVSPGGDYDNAVAGSFTASATGPVTVDITELADGWVRGLWPNHGLILLSEPASGNNEKKYTSSDDDAAPDEHPSLTITYACECGTVCVQPQGSGRIKMVISNYFDPHPDDWYKWSLFRSWGYDVDFIDDSADGYFFDIGLTGGNVIYVSATVSASTLGRNIEDAWLGVVSEEAGLTDDMGFTTGSTQPVGQTVTVADNSHFITAVFPTGALDVFDEAMQGATTSGTMAPDANVLATWNGEGAIVALEKGAQNNLGNPATSRRVQLPLGDAGNINLDYVSHNGWVAVQRAIAWAMGPSAATGAIPLLMVVADDSNLSTQEDAKIALFETWNYVVTVIDDGAQQNEFDDLVATNEVVYVGEDINSGSLDTKLRDAAIGVVIEEEKITDEFGISTGETTFTESSIDIVDNTHYITLPFSPGSVAFASSSQPVGGRAGTLAPGLSVLAEKPSSSTSMLDALETGAALADSGTAAGRRVKLPWGGNDFDINSLTDDGRTILRRSIEWATGATLPGPVAHWKLDETSGTTAIDSEGGHDGTTSNTEWATGQLDGAIRLNSTTDAVVVPHSDELSLTSALTVTAWINKTGLSLYDAAVSKATTGSDLNYFFGTWENYPVFGFSTSTDNWQGFYATSAPLSLNTWYHVAASFDNDGNLVKIYVDGVLVDQFNTTREPVTNAGDIRLGRSAIGEYWPGMLDDVRIYDRALSDSEVSELATRPPKVPIAHWKLDETSGTTAEDSIGGHDGTLINGPSWVSGTIDGGLSLDGSNDFVDVVHDDALSLTTFSISAWIRPSAVDDWYVIVRKGFSGSNANYFLSTELDEIRFGFVNSGFVEFKTSGANLAAGNWYHIAGTFDDATGEGKVYLDGSLMHTGTTALSPLPNSDALTLGRTGPIRFFPGDLDDVRIYDTVLSESEIAALAGGGGGGGGGGGPSSCNGTFRDNFDTRAWNGSNGSLSWATDWIEVGESNGPTSGDIQVMNDASDFQLRTRDNDNGGEGVEREANLSGAATATLNYDFRRMNLDNTNDYTSVEISANGASGPWTELTRHDGSGNDSNYQPASHDISAFVSASTRVRFITSSNMGGTDTVWFDNIEIQCGD
ncbi:MAG: DNRLRE domain-containing protein [Woeseiaceae bacterium]|nr:DNRLRE domain-containing protein [Woeseiaceae bacterium]